MLKKQQRVTNGRDFQNIYRRGRHLSSAFFGLNYLKNNFGFSRLGVVVSKKTARKATDRNLLKRRVREILRLNYAKISLGFDIIITLKGSTSGVDFKKLEEELLTILNKLR